ncbi:MAG: kelch repeat-containing protein [Planctomycetota bacterium]
MRLHMLVFTALLGAAAHGQTLHLDKYGGAFAETTTFTLTGQPNRAYVLFFDFEETHIDLGPGLQLEVGLDYIGLAARIPGFAGFLNATGVARVSIVIPPDPLLVGCVLSLQALLLSPLDTVSNLVRVTPAEVGSFSETLQAPPVTLIRPVAAPQSDGRVLLASGQSLVGLVYDPDREEFSPTVFPCVTGPLNTATRLADGRILLAGGIGLDGQPSNRCTVFDLSTGQCTESTMGLPRAGHAAALTATGEVLIAGGFQLFDFTDLLTAFRGITNTSELYDPVTNTFRAGPTLLEPKAFHAATPTADGGVLVTGGLTLIPVLDIPFVSNTAYKFDAGSGRFGFPVFFGTGRLLHGAALLDNEQVLLAGGVTIDFSAFLNSGDLADLAITALDDGELWKDGFLDGRFETIPGLSRGRALPAVLNIPGTRALVAGGLDLYLSGDISTWVFAPLDSADLYAAKAFTPAGSMLAARIDPLGYLLDDGTVLVLGGASTAEIYQP